MEQKELEKRRFCAKCGAELEADALFCEECGARQEPQAPLTQETPIQYAPMQEAATREEAPMPEPARNEKEAPVHTVLPSVVAASAGAAEAGKKTPLPPKDTASAKGTMPVPQPKGAPGVCVRCGAALEDGAAFCAKCGAAQKTEPPAPPAPPAPRVCVQCGAPLAPDAVFCSKCGTSQPPTGGAAPTQQAQPTGTAQGMGLPPIDMNELIASAEKSPINKVLLGASILAAASVCMPLVNIVGMANLRLMDISEIASVLVVLLGLGAAYASLQGKYEIPVVVGHGFLFTFLFGIYKYQGKLGDLEKNFWSAMMKNAIGVGWGAYILPIAILVMIGGGLVGGLQKDGMFSQDKDTMIARWKKYMLQPVQIHTMNLLGLAWAAGIAVVLIFVALQSGGARQLGL